MTQIKEINELRRKQFVDFIDKYDIKARIAGKILDCHQNAIAMRKSGNYNTTEKDIKRLKIGYFMHLRAKISELTEELIKEELIFPAESIS